MTEDTEALETDLLLEGIFQKYGCDFRAFREDFVHRKIMERMRWEGLDARCKIYATDLDETLLEEARQGAISAASMRKLAGLHLRSGGKTPLSGHYRETQDKGRFDPKEPLQNNLNKLSL